VLALCQPKILMSVPSLGVYYCQQLTLCLSLPLSVTLLFVSQWNRAIFGCHFSMCPSTKRCFDLGPLTPKICTKSPISRLVWQIDQRCLGLPGGFRGWPIQWNNAKCCGADPCCHGNEIWARHGDPVAYQLVLLFSFQETHFFALVIVLM